MDDIKVTVIMPVYNSGRFLEDAVHSILTQSLREIELLLVDDGSTDGSAEACDRYAQADSRVRVIHQQNQGICAARNAGLAIARGQYIAFSDHDDVYGARQLEDNYCIAEDFGADVVKFGSRAILSNGGNVYRTDTRRFEPQTIDCHTVGREFWGHWRREVFNGVWDSLFRRDFLEANGIRFDSFYRTGGEDFDFNWQCVGHGAVYVLNEKVYYTHFIRAGISTSDTYKPYTTRMVLKRPEILLSHIAPLRLDPAEAPAEYLFFILRLIVGSLCHLISHPQCELSRKEKKAMLAGIKEAPYYFDWMQQIGVRDIMKLAPRQYGLLWWLFKHGFYGACLRLYSRQHQSRGIK